MFIYTTAVSRIKLGDNKVILNAQSDKVKGDKTNSRTYVAPLAYLVSNVRDCINSAVDRSAKNLV